MKKWLLPVLLLMMAVNCYAQDGLSLLVLKKKERTIKTYMPGSRFEAIHRNGSELNGQIRKVSRDTVHLSSFYLQRTGNEKGFIFFDTIYTALPPFPVSDIFSIQVPKNNFAYRASEYTAYLAGVWFTIMSVVNGSKFNQKGGEVLREIGIRGGGFFLLGRIFRWLGRDEFRLGKKYRLVTVL
jgi:hypothetical protein